MLSTTDSKKGDTSLPVPPTAQQNNNDGDSGDESEARDVVKDLRSAPGAGAGIAVDNDNSRMSEVSRLSVLPANQVFEYSKESIVHTYLGVLVTKGESLAKKQNDSKLHVGYQVAIRILFTSEMPSSTLDPKVHHIDQYNTQYAALPAHKITKVFDGYRSLHQKLEEYNIFSVDRVKNSKSSNNLIVVEAKFPRTHKRSAFGMSLTEKEVAQRTAELNHWLGALLAKFPQYSRIVRELIQEFLQLDEDNPAEPHCKVMIQMLKKEFEFPLLPPPPGAQQGTSNGKQAARRKTKLFGGDDDKKGGDPNAIGMTGEEGMDEMMPGEGVQCGCQCVVM